MRVFKNSHDRIVVSTSRCGRDNPGSNPGHGIEHFKLHILGKNTYHELMFISMLFDNGKETQKTIDVPLKRILALLCIL